MRIFIALLLCACAGAPPKPSTALAALHDLTPAQLDRQREIVRLSAAVNHARDLPAYERAVAPLLLANAVDAARMEIDDLAAAVHALPPEVRERMHVIVVGAHMARDREIAMQYFEKLPGELQLLGTHLLDASVGQGFFGDPLRMHRDLLSDAAAKVLAE